MHQLGVRPHVCYSETEMNPGQKYGRLGGGHATCGIKRKETETDLRSGSGTPRVR